MDVAPWCYKCVGLDGLDGYLRLVGGKEHLLVLKRFAFTFAMTQFKFSFTCVTHNFEHHKSTSGFD